VVRSEVRVGCAPSNSPAADDLSKGQWRGLLEAIAATPAEILDVLRRLDFSIT
jgi:hypothetical protein